MLQAENEIAQRIRKLSENAIEQLHKISESRLEIDHLYKVEKVLGEGAFASVYRGRRRSDNKQVALKILSQANIMEWSQDQNEIFPTEAVIHKSLHHPNVIQLMDVLTIQGSYVLVLETDENFKLLFDVVKDKRRLQEVEARTIFAQVVDAVKYCLDCSVWHRDIKAENVLVHRESLLTKLIDFGCACRTDQRHFSNDRPGTLEYCPPEYFSSDKCGPESSSVWSLGVLLSFMIHGKLPFADINEILTKGTVRNPRISKELSGLLVSMLAKNPADRIDLSTLQCHNWVRGQSDRKH